MKYTGEYTKTISFPLGGIGTGSIGLGGDGRLIDWEIFNRPSKGSLNGYTHFAVRTIKGETIISAVLNGDLQNDFIGPYQRENVLLSFGNGPDYQSMCGLPHFENTVFNGEFPIGTIEFKDKKFPADIQMTAFNPFIPRDSKNSSLPVAFFEIEVENTEACEIKYQVAFSVANPYSCSVNEYAKKGNCHLIKLSNGGADKNDTAYGDLTVATDADKVYHQSYWYRGSWQDGIVTYWNEFSSDIELCERTYDTAGCNDVCTLIAEIDALPKEKKKVRFVLSWNVPNNYNYWAPDDSSEIRKPWKNYYATVFENSSETAVYALEIWENLYSRTMLFKEALHDSSLPPSVTDAVSANLSVLKSPTVLRLEDGSFYGWEGVQAKEGSCEGTCQHVWNYAYAMCFLFPDLERSIRDMEFRHSTDDDGRMGFRIMLPLGRKMTDFRACVDGQMGAVIKCYREWKISGDGMWLRENWENIKKVLEYAWREKNPDGWDRDKDGVLEGRQHHTLDMELFGPSSWLQGMYLLALRAASEMAEFLGDDHKAKEYRDIYNKGYKWTKENLFNGKYFVQKIDLSDKSITDRFNASDVYWNSEAGEIKYQIANGSSIDQLLGQWHADILGLGDIFDKSQIDSALSEMMKNNFKPSMRDFVNTWRVFSLNDEAGTVICDYPGEKPKIGISYNGETMTGFEYAFGGLLLSRGKIEEGLKVIKAVRDRFDGKKRNPWNEFECGSNYARSMASFALVPILSGFEFDMPNNHIGFNPYKTEKFNSVWSLSDAWGVFSVDGDTVEIAVYEGEITLKSIGIKFADKVCGVNIDGRPLSYEYKDGKVSFEKTIVKNKIIINKN